MGLTVQDAPVYELIPEGTIFRATVTGAGEKEMTWEDKFRPGQKEVRVNFKFKAQDGTWKGRVILGDTFTSMHKGTRLYNWVCSMLDMDELPVGLEIEYEDLLDSEVEVTVGVRGKDDNLRNYAQYVNRLGAGIITDDEEPF